MVIGGYLKGHALAMDSCEIPSPRLPQCLELVCTTALLQSFLQRSRDHLQGVRSVFLRGEEARIEAALDRKELEQILGAERPSTNPPD